MSALYEAWFVAGVLILAALPFVRLTHYAIHPEWRHVYQVYLWFVLGVYFTGFWHRHGQTIPMRTWRLGLVDKHGHPPSWAMAWLRYGLALPGFVTGLSWLWALVDRDGQFLHDRILGLTLKRL